MLRALSPFGRVWSGVTECRVPAVANVAVSACHDVDAKIPQELRRLTIGSDNEWVQAPTRGEYSLLVNSGEKLQIYSNGLFPSTMHTASSIDPSRGRFSTPFFWSPNNDLIVEPLPEFVSEERPSRYEASVSGFVYSSGRKEDVDTYGGTGDDRADTFALPQREAGDTEDARANTFALPRRDKTSKL